MKPVKAGRKDLGAAGIFGVVVVVVGGFVGGGLSLDVGLDLGFDAELCCTV
jgi:hypothetical protein